jgi:hypothetical protein
MRWNYETDIKYDEIDVNLIKDNNSPYAYLNFCNSS